MEQNQHLFMEATERKFRHLGIEPVQWKYLKFAVMADIMLADGRFDAGGVEGDAWRRSRAKEGAGEFAGRVFRDQVSRGAAIALVRQVLSELPQQLADDFREDLAKSMQDFLPDLGQVARTLQAVERLGR